MPVDAVVLGASGFGGGELLRILMLHPGFRVVAAGASTRAGQPVGLLYPGLGLYDAMQFTTVDDALQADAEVVFASLPHGESAKVLPGAGAAKVIDLGGDFRLNDAGAFERWHGRPHTAPEQLAGWTYGLTEFHREAIAASARVANPGCYPAAAILALGPLLEAGLVDPEPIHIDAKSGVSGAGRASAEGFDFVSANENTRPYRPTGHDHIPEMEQELTGIAKATVKVSFVPHLVPMTRGVEISAVAVGAPGATSQILLRALRDRYEGEPFVRVLDESLPETKRLTGTNYAEVAVRKDERTGKVLAFAALDNLGKGAAGQAVQNANIMLGLAETDGLLMAAGVP